MATENRGHHVIEGRAASGHGEQCQHHAQARASEHGPPLRTLPQLQRILPLQDLSRLADPIRRGRYVDPKPTGAELRIVHHHRFT